MSDRTTGVTASLTAGFTLIELMVVTAIMVLITMVVLFNTGRFNSSVLLRSLAYEVGLSLRTAQLYGVSVREATSGDFNAAYGVFFPVSIINVPNASYSLFADLNNNGIFDDGTSAIEENFLLQNSFAISDICATTGSSMICAAGCPSPLPAGITSCAPQSIATGITISFKRPNPNALIIVDSNTSQPYAGAIITVSSPAGSTRTTSVTSTGLITVQGEAQ